jgi:hypothetical protein
MFSQEQLLSLKRKWGSIYKIDILGTEFVYRCIGRQRLKEILSLGIPDAEVEEIVCRECTLYPENFDFENCPGGVPSRLYEAITQSSGLTQDDLKCLLYACEDRLSSFDAQVDLIIFEAFRGTYTLEEIQSWPQQKVMARFAQAKWILNLRGTPIEIQDPIPPELRPPVE